MINYSAGSSGCDHGQVRIVDEYLDLYSISGRLEICVEETYLPVCGFESSHLNATALVMQACIDIGYGG